MEALDTVLFGKYQLCRILGTGRVGTVFLAVHLGLSEYRAIKRVPKSFLDYERFRREALILKELRHPGIPIVYDVEEDENYSYLIEEYLEGESLHDLVAHQGHLSREQTIVYGMQLTRIVSYLHLAGPNPILHLDLQPKNLLLCYGTIKLIDFDHAAYSCDINMGEERYGTIGCAAPEQYEKDEILDERTDLYAIGVILHYLHTGTYPHTPLEKASFVESEFMSIIRTCLENDRRDRFSSAQELYERLEQLACRRTAVVYGRQIPSLTIAFAGSRPGAGTTHMAIGLSVHLRNLGYANLYEEHNDSGMGAALGEYTKSTRDRYGLMQHHGFVWKPRYGPGVKLADPPCDIRIQDYGAELEHALLSEPDGIILVCDGKSWSASLGNLAVKRVLESHLPYAVIYNHEEEKRRRPVKGLDKNACFLAPEFGDLWKESKGIKEFYREIVTGLLRGIPGMENLADGKRRHGWLRRKWYGAIGRKKRKPGSESSG